MYSTRRIKEGDDGVVKVKEKERIIQLKLGRGITRIKKETEGEDSDKILLN